MDRRLFGFRFLACTVLAFVTPTMSMVGCAKKSTGAVTATPSPTPSYNPADWAACNDHITADYIKPGATLIIPYHINSVMADPVTGNTTCTPRAIRQKIKDVFDLYASIPESGIAFKYAGEDPVDYNLAGNDPFNRPNYFGGSLDIILTDHSTGYSGVANRDNIWGVAGSGYANPTATNYLTYYGGFASLVLHSSSGTQSPGAINFGLLLHEIGHALGLDHIPAKGANMSRYSGGFFGDFYAFTEQERANIAAVYPATGKTIYQISGTVVTNLTGNATASSVVEGIADVYAVDITNGRTYTGLAHGTTSPLKYWINILHPGSYRLVAIPDGYPGMGYDPSSRQASWYIDNTTATNDPLAGTIITVNNTTPKVSNVAINLINSPAAYYLPAEYEQRDSSDPTFNPTYMYGGDSGTFQFWQLCGGSSAVAHCDPVTAIEPYGTSPDYSFSNLTVINDLGAFGAFYTAKVTVNAGAAPGHRIAIGRSTAGTNQVVVLGVHVLNGPAKPANLSTSCTAQQQIGGCYDLTTLKPTWWF
jgi:hypothetical protein